MFDHTYGHTPYKKAFDLGDVYGVGQDEQRAARRRIRLGIIGCGGVAQSKYFPAVARLRTVWEPIEIAAFAEPQAAQANKVQAIYGGQWYADYQEMLHSETLDGVVVLSPDDLHAEHALAALECGLPVLVEKPITRSLQDAQSLCKRADEKGLLLMTVATKRFSPPYRRAKHFVEHGSVKNPAMFVGKFNLGYGYVDLFESGTIHLYDLTRYFMGDVASLSAVGVNRYRKNGRHYPIDNAIVSCEFVSGAVGALYTSASALSFKPWERVEIYGDKAWLSVEDQYELIVYDDEIGPAQSWRPVVPNTLLFDEEFGGFMGLLENFAQAIRGSEPPLVSGWDGYRAYEMNVATHLALARKTPVRLPLDPAEADREALDWLKQAGWPGGT